MFVRTFVKFYEVIGNATAKKQPIHDKFARQGANLITFEAFDPSRLKNAANLFLVIPAIRTYVRALSLLAEIAVWWMRIPRDREQFPRRGKTEIVILAWVISGMLHYRNCDRSSLSTLLRCSMITFQRLRKFLLLRIWRNGVVRTYTRHACSTNRRCYIRRVHSFERMLKLN